METINLVYIDDTPDIDLSRYLDNLHQYYTSNGFVFEYYEIPFDNQKDYSSLLKDARVQTANIIIIDSRLFENKPATGGKFSGEEFKFVLQKFYPYIEVIVITQNESDPELNMVSKYVKNSSQTGVSYYAAVMPQYLDSAIEKIKQYRILAKKVNENDSWESVLKEKVLGTLSGTQAYDELTKDDIDTLIHAFREIRKSINGC